MAGRTASSRLPRLALGPALLLLGLGGCSPDLSPNTYNSAAVQHANEADQGVVVGVREVDVQVSGTTGAVVGGAAGGIAGSQLGNGTTSAFGALGGSLIGGLIGSGVEHASGDTKAYEYIVRRSDKKLVSVTQKDDPPLAVGQRVLVITGPQARIVPDYTVKLPPEAPETAKQSAAESGPPTPVQATGSATPADQPAAPAAAPTEPTPVVPAEKPVVPVPSDNPVTAVPANPVPTTVLPGPVNLLPVPFAIPGSVPAEKPAPPPG